MPRAPGPRNRLRLKRRLRLRQINQILRHALFFQHPPDHVFIAPRAPQTRFDDQPSVLGLEKTQVLQHRIVHAQRHVVRDFHQFRDGFLCQTRVARRQSGQIGNFIDGRGLGHALGGIVGFIGLGIVEIVGAHGIDDLIEELRKLDVAIHVDTALLHHSHGAIEKLARFVGIARGVGALPGGIVRLHPRD